ncbi:hypothetical protein BpHYR1_011224 [Brachionus plicatilis]|uniref:Uncharacterized protein n=1 Tax=Brachionus plicatilis TaxID=10195 RepID=A0A3M7SNU6_BRAPC|nr:hypothetical protein BpHYR1_011224 [Brachionus plicatilis]
MSLRDTRLHGHMHKANYLKIINLLNIDSFFNVFLNYFSPRKTINFKSKFGKIALYFSHKDGSNKLDPSKVDNIFEYFRLMNHASSAHQLVFPKDRKYLNDLTFKYNNYLLDSEKNDLDPFLNGFSPMAVNFFFGVLMNLANKLFNLDNRIFVAGYGTELIYIVFPISQVS